MGWFLLTEECTLWTVIVKQVKGDEESNVRKAQVFVALAGKPCSVSHLQSDLQIYWNSYFSYAPLKVWIIWGFLPLSCMSLVFLDIKPLWDIWFGKYLLSICKKPFDFVDVPFFGVWCGPTGLFLQLLPFLLVWDPKTHCKDRWQEDYFNDFF